MLVKVLYQIDAIICSRTLQRIQVREIGLYFAADVLSPFFEDGADFGSTPLCGEFACSDRAFKDVLNNWCNFFT